MGSNKVVRAFSTVCRGRGSFGKLRFVSGSVLLLSGLLFTGAVLAQGMELQPSAIEQLQALQADKASRTPAQRKIDSQLLFALKKQRREPVMSKLPDMRISVDYEPDGRVKVDIRADVDDALLAEIRSLGGDVVNSHPRFNMVRAILPLESLESLATSNAVKAIRRADKMQLNKVNTSEGDVAHAADVARPLVGVDGTGVKVGVLSDSVDALAALQASGDLPPVVTILPGQDGGVGSSEGTAMLEIVHDLAPGAELYFATAFGGQAQFAQNIIDLQAAGCSVIVDDVGYFAEAVFQDGIVASAVNQVTAAGALYFSSAGNSGNLNDGTSGVWQGDYVGMAAVPPMNHPDALDFGGGTVGNTITQDSPSVFTLQWSDPQGASSNDYDLYMFDPGLTTILASSESFQDGTQDPFEGFDSPGDDTGNVLVVGRWLGDPRFIHLNANRGRLAIATDGQTHGHSSAADAFSVAAVNVATAGGGVFIGGPANPVEPFSSDGPRQIFYQQDGTPITPGDFLSTGGAIRQKPDITAADGVATATPGFDPFFGTSAAAPHAAAIAALMKQQNPALTPAGARNTFSTTALDIEGPGVDRDSGFGIIMADSVLGPVPAPNPPNMYCSSPGSTIPGPGSVIDTISIAETGTVSDISVQLDIGHTWLQDLTVTLQHGAGTIVTLVDRPEDNSGTGSVCSGDDMDVTLWDGAADSVQDSCVEPGPPSLLGLFAPANPLSAFDGDGLSGNWHLTVTDNTGLEPTDGTLHNWCILPISHGVCDGPDVTYTGPDVAAPDTLVCNVGYGAFSGFNVLGDLIINGSGHVEISGPFSTTGTLEINMMPPAP